MTVMMSAVNQKKHVFSSVFVQLRYSTLFQKKTPTGVGKAGKPFQVQSSSGSRN